MVIRTYTSRFYLDIFGFVQMVHQSGTQFHIYEMIICGTPLLRALSVLRAFPAVIGIQQPRILRRFPRNMLSRRHCLEASLSDRRSLAQWDLKSDPIHQGCQGISTWIAFLRTHSRPTHHHS